MQIANRVTMLDITTTMMGSPNTIYPVLLKDESSCLLVDTGFPGDTCLGVMTQRLASLDVSIQSLDKVILTHQDLDHIGGLPGLTAQNPRLQILTHKTEKPYVEGEKKLIKISKSVSDGLEQMPEKIKQALLYVFNNPPTAKVDKVLEDGDTLPYCGGITVIHTPGHTPGHICLYLHAAKTLIAGDALTAHDGTLLGPVDEHASDFPLAYASLEKLLDYDIEKVICYHGGLAECGTERIREIIAAH